MLIMSPSTQLKVTVKGINPNVTLTEKNKEPDHRLHTNSCVGSCTYTMISTCTQRWACANVCVHAHTHKHTHTYIHTCVCIHTNMCAHMPQSDTHTNTHSHQLYITLPNIISPHLQCLSKREAFFRHHCCMPVATAWSSKVLDVLSSHIYNTGPVTCKGQCK